MKDGLHQIMKKCTNCLKEKNENEFYIQKSKGRENKLTPNCKSCYILKSRTYRKNNPEIANKLHHPKIKCPDCCINLMNIESKRCRTCYEKIAKGDKHPSWTGGRHKIKTGYIRIFMPEHPHALNGKYIFEHTLVMEKKIGRFLNRNELVHHKNGVKDDNREDNLELWVKGHNPNERAEDLLKWAKEIIELYGNLFN